MAPTFLALPVLLGLVGLARAYDMGPTFGKDYAGEDYSVVAWNTPKSAAANNYEQAAWKCEQECLKDEKW